MPTYNLQHSGQSQNHLYSFFVYASVLVFILGEGTILLEFTREFVPFYSHSITTILLMTFTIMLGFSLGIKITLIRALFDGKLLLKLAPIIFFILAVYADVFVNINGQLHPQNILVFAFRHILFIILILQAMVRGVALRVICAPYFLTIFVILVTGTILLVCSVLFDDFVTKSIDVSYLGKAGEGGLGKNLYTMPYGLGLILLGQNHINFFDYVYPPYSSYFIEPQVFGFYFIPAFILFIGYGYKRYNKLVYLLTLFSAACLILWAHSAASLLALIIVVSVWGILNRPAQYIAFCLIVILAIWLFTEVSIDDINNMSIVTSFSSGSFDGTIYGLVNLVRNIDILGEPINLRASSGSGSFSDRNFSLISLLLWGLYVMLIGINALIELVNNKKSIYAYVFIFLLVSIFKDIFHSPQSVVLIYMYMLFFFKHYSAIVLRQWNNSAIRLRQSSSTLFL